MNESHRQHREDPTLHPRKNLPDAERTRFLLNKKKTGGLSGNAHQRAVARKKLSS